MTSHLFYLVSFFCFLVLFLYIHLSFINIRLLLMLSIFMWQWLNFSISSIPISHSIFLIHPFLINAYFSNDLSNSVRFIWLFVRFKQIILFLLSDPPFNWDFHLLLHGKKSFQVHFWPFDYYWPTGLRDLSVFFPTPKTFYSLPWLFCDVFVGCNALCWSFLPVLPSKRSSSIYPAVFSKFIISSRPLLLSSARRGDVCQT